MGRLASPRSSCSASRKPPAAWVAAFRIERLDFASIGREMAVAISAKHIIKRGWRFSRNRRVEVHQAMADVAGKLTRERKRPLIVVLNRTDVRSCHTLMAAA